LAKIWLKLGRFRDAIPELELVKPRRPERSLIHDQLAYCYLATGDDRKAEATLREVQSPENVRRSLEKMRASLHAERVIR
jgi:predicted Zn-dependent protease